MRPHYRAFTTIAAVTAVIGVLAAIALAAGLPGDQRTFASVVAPVELLISVGVPFLGAVATSSLHLKLNPNARGTILRAVSWAVGFAVLGVVAASVVVGIFPSGATAGRWEKALLLVLGSVLVQVVAQLTGTGFGLLLRRPVMAPCPLCSFRSGSGCCWAPSPPVPASG